MFYKFVVALFLCYVSDNKHITNFTLVMYIQMRKH